MPSSLQQFDLIIAELTAQVERDKQIADLSTQVKRDKQIADLSAQVKRDEQIAELPVQDTQRVNEPTPVAGTLEYANHVLQRVNKEIAAGTLTPYVFAEIIPNLEVSKVVDAYQVQFEQATESKQPHLFVIGAAGTGKSTFANRFSKNRIVFGIDMMSYGPKGFAFTRENAKVGAAIARSLLAQTQVRVVFTYAGKASSFEVAVKGHGRRVPNSEIIVLGEILSKTHAHSVLESTKTRRRQLCEVVTLPGFEVFIKPLTYQALCAAAKQRCWKVTRDARNAALKELE